jgi:NTP pyrophosphatase (non-canonical NTP hydrolase)
MQYLSELADSLHETAKAKGFWKKVYPEGTYTQHSVQDIDFMLAKLALVHSEVSEVLEAMRKQMGEEKIVEELVDIFIRLMDFYAGAKATGWVTSSFDDILEKKVGINKERPPMHGNLA